MKKRSMTELRTEPVGTKVWLKDGGTLVKSATTQDGIKYGGLYLGFNYLEDVKEYYILDSEYEAACSGEPVGASDGYSEGYRVGFDEAERVEGHTAPYWHQRFLIEKQLREADATPPARVPVRTMVLGAWGSCVEMSDGTWWRKKPHSYSTTNGQDQWEQVAPIPQPEKGGA